jgi:protein required for attachment to host cells
MNNWLLVANASRARVLEETDTPGQYDPVADLVHPQSRLKADELGADHAGGQSGIDHERGSIGYAPRTDPRRHERALFAIEVAKRLSDGVAHSQCAGLTLVASEAFLGEVKSHLSPAAAKAVLRTIAADYTVYDGRDLAQRIAGHRA